MIVNMIFLQGRNWMSRLNIIYEVFIFFLILLYLTVIIVGYSGSEVLSRQEIKWLDYSLIVYFFIEYIVRLYLAPKKWVFVKRNIFDLIALIPFDAFFKIARLMRLIRLIRIMKFSKTIRGIFNSGGLSYVVAFTVLVMSWGSISVYVLEKGSNPSINSFSDSIWWSIVTVTTVGYGDISPVTEGGRIIAGILMLVGIGLIGSITGSMAIYFADLHNAGKPKEEKLDPNADLNMYINSQLGKIETLNEEELEHLLASIRVLYKKRKEEGEV